ncbi:GIN domain-containing protein [Mucilaginibacter auburnensis]|uniref:Putative auto-transporter adhesin head GIN domain-containing protein n=1 Tax=Mucilaginibacter auburnensis TaxID=1457233 RepID=A0A2H9VVJ4_9SPHI|nr:DUF2807 domain-containing protein [Mucilaginibacter auburnensis]PJJ84802.1 hypothetical protein CLV57_1824 [Mucilaginibacter auburnensis]
MKTKFTTIIATVALLISTITIAQANDDAVTLTSAGHINKIEASGNVEVYITNGKEDGVKVYNDYYAQNAMVQNEDGTLRIASYKNDALIVLVTVTDLRAITANDHAIIKSYNGLSALSLNIDLNDKAIASLDVDAVAANITVNDNARADLYGMIQNYHIDYSATASVNKNELEAYSSSEREIVKPTFSRTPRNFRVTAAL